MTTYEVDYLGNTRDQYKEETGHALPPLESLDPFGGPTPEMTPEQHEALLKELRKLSAEIKDAVSPKRPVEKQARIRVWLSRPLTWAEKEWIETNHDDPHSRRINQTDTGGLKLRVSTDMQHVWVDGYFGSRVLFDLVAAVLEQHFVNVFPKAVRTFTEYNGE
jgi:hypothetical protein